MTATLASGRHVTTGEKGGTYVSQALAAIRVEGGIEEWVKVIMKVMYQGKNNSPGANPIVGFRINLTEYPIAEGLSLVSKKKRTGT